MYFLVERDINGDPRFIVSAKFGTAVRFESIEEARAHGIKRLEEDELGPDDVYEGEDSGALSVFICHFDYRMMEEIDRNLIDRTKIEDERRRRGDARLMLEDPILGLASTMEEGKPREK